MNTDRLDCGCYAIRFCPLHQAAPALLAACQDALFVLENITTLDFSRGGDAKVRGILEAAIRTARGEEGGR